MPSEKCSKSDRRHILLGQNKYEEDWKSTFILNPNQIETSAYALCDWMDFLALKRRLNGRVQGQRRMRPMVCWDAAVCHNSKVGVRFLLSLIASSVFFFASNETETEQQQKAMRRLAVLAKLNKTILSTCIYVFSVSYRLAIETEMSICSRLSCIWLHVLDCVSTAFR